MDEPDRAALERAAERLGVRYDDLCDAELLLSYAASYGVDVPDDVPEAIFATRQAIQAAASAPDDAPEPVPNDDVPGPLNGPEEEM